MLSETYNSGCIKAMREYDDGAFDWAVVDPPYGNPGSRDAFAAQKGINRAEVGTNKPQSKKNIAWDVRPPRVYWDELFRISKNQIVFGGNYFTDILPPSKNWIIWHKPNISDAFSMANCELVWISKPGNAKIISIPSNLDLRGRIHPTQKPVKLYADIFARFCKPGDKIIDTHLGSGSSRIAAHAAGLDFVGYEIDADMFAKQEERWAAYKESEGLLWK